MTNIHLSESILRMSERDDSFLKMNNSKIFASCRVKTQTQICQTVHRITHKCNAYIIID